MGDVHTAPKPPRTRSVVVGTLLLSLLAVHWITRLDEPQSAMNVFGLALDVFGASIIAVPDVREISRFFYNGKLRSASITLNEREAGYGGLSAPGTSNGFDSVVDSDGFWEVVDTMEGIYDDSSLEAGRSWRDFSSLMPVSRPSEGSTTGDPSLDYERVFVCFDSEHERLFTADAQTVLSAIRRRIEEIDGRFRRAGLSILVTGFVVQIVARFV